LLEGMDWRLLIHGPNPISRTDQIIGAARVLPRREGFVRRSKPLRAIPMSDQPSARRRVGRQVSPGNRVRFDATGDYAKQTDAAQVLVRVTSSRQRQARN
jgi:hypothetical protein